MALVYKLQVVCYLLLLFVFLCNLVVNSQLHVCDPKESFALLEFKNVFSSETPSSSCKEQYPRTTTWNESTDCCSWEGVECDEEGEGHVVGLHLSCSFLYGTLHPNSTLFTLSHLQTLNLSKNNFSGSSFSPQFGMLTNLKVLDLSDTFFQGDVPFQISYLSNLVSLHLSHNYHLKFSNLVMNQLVHNLTNLRDFRLAGTILSHITPTSFMNFSLSLESLDLSSSDLSGNFPDHIFGLPNLRVLQLLDNPELNGHLPMSNWSKSLEILELFRTNFSGGIPSSIGEAKALRYLNLNLCNFNGEISNFETHSNHFMGQLEPNCVLDFTQEVSSNSFSSPLTPHVCSHRLSNLVHLDLGRNSFTGVIPSWLFSLPNLKYLALYQNHFSGFMRDFGSNSLEYLDVCFNNLEGKIPLSIYTQVKLTELRLCSNDLSGVFNLDMLIIPSLTLLDVSNNSQLSIFSTKAISSNLVTIGMSSVKLKSNVPPYFLRYQKNLSYLELSHNSLSSGIEDLLALPKLERLFLDFNLFNKLPIPILLPSMMLYFSVSNNEVSGNIHHSICEATNLLFLDLSNNSFSGAIPSCLSNMPNLRFLLLKSNNFSGVVPMPPSISYYLASENHFTGEIPSSICFATNLVILGLSNNHLSGTIPPCLTNIASLLALNLESNNFSGTIPSTFSTTSQLRSLDLNNNKIEGELPYSLLNCENLQILDVGNNNITGHFPHWLESVSSLRVLILRSNRFYGHINNSFNTYSFSNLRIIDLSYNHFGGPLPSNLFRNLRAIKEFELLSQSYNYLYPEWFIIGSSDNYEDSLMVTLKGSDQKLGRILRAFKAMDLSSNDFSGEIPKSIGMLLFLKGLNISNNKLTGEIPMSFGNLTNLEWLDLSSNELRGQIPPQLAALTFLSVLNLSQNQLSGPIPQGKQFATFDSSSYVGNLGLCDFPLPKCDGDKARDGHESQLVDDEEDDGLTKGFWLKVVFMGYGCGMLFGMFVGFLVFRIGRPVWIVAMVEGKPRRNIYRAARRNN